MDFESCGHLGFSQDTSPRNRPLQSSTIANTRDKDAIINALGQVLNPLLRGNVPVFQKQIPSQTENSRAWQHKQ